MPRPQASQDRASQERTDEAAGMTRWFRMLTEVQDRIIHADDEAQLLAETCQIMVDVGGYRMAWIGYKGDPPACRVEPVARAGHDTAYLDDLVITWSDDEHGRGPTGRAVRMGRPQIARDIARDRRFAPWREQAKRHGFASSAALPLTAMGEVLGALMVYAHRRNAFDEKELDVLERLASNLSYGIAERRSRDALARAERNAREWATALEFAAWGVAFSSVDGRHISRVNKTFAEQHGFRPEELEGMPVLDLYPEDEHENVQRHVQIAAKTGHHQFESRHLRKDGSEFPVLVDINAVSGPYRFVFVQDLTEAKRAEAAERHLREQAAEVERLREADRVRARIMSEIAHELRNPLTPLRLQMGILKVAMPKDDGGRLGQTLQIMMRNLDRVDAVVQDLQEASRLGAGTMRIALRPLDLGAVVRDFTDAYKDVAAEAGLELTVDADVALPVSADRVRLEQVLANLIGNARKYTPQGGHIRVRATVQEECARVEVEDDGLGIDAEVLPRLFTPFGRAGKTAREGETSTGLGLFITKGMVELHGGKMGCHSDGPGQGSVFWFTVPLLA